MTLLQRLTMIQIVWTFTATAMSLVHDETGAPIAAYAADTLDINSATADQLKHCRASATPIQRRSLTAGRTNEKMTWSRKS
jgi:hypothetical protein